MTTETKPVDIIAAETIQSITPLPRSRFADVLRPRRRRP